MFAKHKLGAACLADYKNVKKGAIVPAINELYAEVEVWVRDNGWLELPPDFGTHTPTADGVRAERDVLIEKVSNEISRLWDNGGDYAPWQTYRQFLRDVPEQAGFPTDVDWGVLPAEFTGA